MMAKTPVNLEKIGKEDLNKEILRTGVIAEMDAINLYEQMAALTTKVSIKKSSFGHCEGRKNACRRILGSATGRGQGTTKRIRGRKEGSRRVKMRRQHCQ
jgi:hypothetical protein